MGQTGKPFYAYTVALEICRAVRPLVPVLKRKDGKIAVQLREAAKSVPANVSEGRSRLGADRQYFFSIAAGSNSEVRTHLEVALAFDYLTEEQLGELPALLDREARLLWGLLH